MGREDQEKERAPVFSAEPAAIAEVEYAAPFPISPAATTQGT
jgi:hypothetical protein